MTGSGTTYAITVDECTPFDPHSCTRSELDGFVDDLELAIANIEAGRWTSENSLDDFRAAREELLNHLSYRPAV